MRPAIIDAAIGRIGPGEWKLTESLLPSSLRACCCWRTAASMVIALAAGPPNRCRLVGRCADNRQLPVVEALADGSHLSEICPNDKAAPGAASCDPGSESSNMNYPRATRSRERYRLMTSLLDPEAAPTSNWRRSTTSDGRSRVSRRTQDPPTARPPRVCAQKHRS